MFQRMERLQQSVIMEQLVFKLINIIDPATVTLIDVEKKRFLKTIQLRGYQTLHGVQYIDNERFLITDERSRKILLVNSITSLIEKVYDTQPLQCHMVINHNDLGIGSDLANGRVIFFNITNSNVIKSKFNK
jgi:hypothetical protein